MARRPEFEKPNEVLSREQIDDLRRSLLILSPSSVLNFYREAHQHCARRHRPTARAMQQLVTAWKILRRWNGSELEQAGVLGSVIPHASTSRLISPGAMHSAYDFFSH
jgi:hypothetical protein